MPIPASIPGKAHKAGWSPQKPYTCPDERMPRQMGGAYGDGALKERGLAAPMPVGEEHPPLAATITGERPINASVDAERNGDGLRTGRVPKNPAAPATRALPGVKRH